MYRESENSSHFFIFLRKKRSFLEVKTSGAHPLGKKYYIFEAQNDIRVDIYCSV